MVFEGYNKVKPNACIITIAGSTYSKILLLAMTNVLKIHYRLFQTRVYNCKS